MPPRSPEVRLYGREFQQLGSTAAAPTTGWLRKMVSGQKPPEQRLFGSKFFDREA
jgi:hypothetical protein